MKIGFFDSGLGGLTILKAVARALPQYDYVYYGDTAHVPYGDKTMAEIEVLTKQAVEYLFDQGCLLVIAACNTVSVSTVRLLQDTMLVGPYADRKILGVVIPTVETVVDAAFKNGDTVVLLGTTRTVTSGKYTDECEKRAMGCTLVPIACAQLVPLIESGKKDEAAALAIKAVTAVGDVQGVILGCTHYTVLKSYLRTTFGDQVRIFSQDEIIPAKLADYLHRHSEIEHRLTRGYTRVVYLTDPNPEYDTAIQELLGGALLEA